MSNRIDWPAYLRSQAALAVAGISPARFMLSAKEFAARAKDEQREGTA